MNPDFTLIWPLSCLKDGDHLCGTWCSTGCQRYGGKWKRFSRHNKRLAASLPQWFSEQFTAGDCRSRGVGPRDFISIVSFSQLTMPGQNRCMIRETIVDDEPVLDVDTVSTGASPIASSAAR